MTDFINSVQPRKNALQANQTTLSNTIVTTDVTTKNITNVATKSKYKLNLKPKEKAELITIRIIKSRKDKIDKIAKKYGTTRQAIVNKAFDFFFENLEEGL